MLRTPDSSPTKVQDILSKFEPRPKSVINVSTNVCGTTTSDPPLNGVSIQTWTLRRRLGQRLPAEIKVRETRSGTGVTLGGVKGETRPGRGVTLGGVKGETRPSTGVTLGGFKRETCPSTGVTLGGVKGDTRPATGLPLGGIKGEANSRTRLTSADANSKDRQITGPAALILDCPVNVSEIAKRFQDKIAEGPGGCSPCHGPEHLAQLGTVRDPDGRVTSKTRVKPGLPLGPPPQKPLRTFAHDIYVTSKLLNGRPEDKDKLSRTQSTLPKKPKLPPKPVRSKTVPSIARIAASKKPRGPMEPNIPQPYASASIDAVEANSVFRTSPFVDFKSTVNYRFRNHGKLKRSRSEEHIYDEPWDAWPRRLQLMARYGKLDRLKSPSLALDEQLSGVVLVDNVVYKRGDSQERRGNGARTTNSPGELHYMSSPIMGHGSPSKLNTMGHFHVYLNESVNDEPDNKEHRVTVGTKKVNFLDCNDIADLSFSSIYNSAPRRKKKNSAPSKDVESDDSDNEISEKEIQKRIKDIRKSMNRGHSVRNCGTGQLQSYRKQFDLVIIVGLKYRDGTTIYQPYVKDIFPGMDSLKVDPNDVAHFCFPDAETWHPASKRETYTFILTDEKGFRLFGYCRRVKPEGVELNIPIVYCIISPILARAYYFQVLGEIEKRHGLSDVKMKSFLQAVQARSVPQPGRTVTIKCSGLDGEQQVTFSRPSDFAMDNGDTYRLLNHLRVSVLIKVFASVLLERRVIFCASQPEMITECIHALISLLYPFIWQHTLIPILPAKMVDVVGSPTPFVIGILSTVVPQLEDLSMEEGLVVDLDSSLLIRDVGDETTIIPKAIQGALSTALKLIKSRTDILESPKSILVSQAFMQMFLELIGHYPKHMSLYDDGQRIFHRESFSTALPSHSIQMFLKWFTVTQMFERFIEDRTSKSMDHEVFEQCIRERQANADLLKPSRRYNVRDFSKKMKNIGERLIGMGISKPEKT